PILEELILPHGSTLKFIISHHGAGVPKSEKVVIDFGSSYVWVIKQGDENGYYLKAIFEIRKTIKSNINKLWYGKIEIPRVKIPENE
ncbi:MAG: hypothetical protein GY707_03960, partial [Desulfobacteraceae bacterium]|nr:hypothetical protein [Desulfobacteraceae bacterium]